MPLGHIKPLAMSTAAHKRIHHLESLKYPRDEKTILHLKPDDFKDWLYLQDPREALLMMSITKTKERFQLQMKPTTFKLVTDFLWRLFK